MHLFFDPTKYTEKLQMSMHSDLTNLKMAALPISQQQLSFYAGIGTQKLSPFLTGQKDLDAVGLLKVHDTLACLEKLAEAALPWPIDFKKVAEVKDLMTKLKNGELDRLIAATREAAAELAPAAEQG
jgi:hypothetical protein